MQKLIYPVVILQLLLTVSCSKEEAPQVCEDEPTQNSSDIVGFNLLSEASGHWIGTNETAYGFYNWFTFDFRPISASHVHSIYEGATAQNILTSFFIADFEGKQQVMARNGGWLGPQYRATYFVLDQANESGQTKYYRLVDAVGGVQRSYIELRFRNDSMYFDAYKDNSGSLDDPILHMSFAGKNINPNLDQPATDLFNFPQEISEVNLNNAFNTLVDPESALFLTEAQDPFPKSDHGHLSDFTIDFNRDVTIQNEDLLFYLSTEPLVDASGNTNLGNINTKVVRTIDITSAEATYTATYVHPDSYYVTAFADLDGNYFPSSGDYSSESIPFVIAAETNTNTAVDINIVVQ